MHGMIRVLDSLGGGLAAGLAAKSDIGEFWSRGVDWRRKRKQERMKEMKHKSKPDTTQQTEGSNLGTTGSKFRTIAQHRMTIIFSEPCPMSGVLVRVPRLLETC